LVCQHDAEGAFGLVLNRAAGKKVGDAIVADLRESLKEQPLYLGGPVQPSLLSYLHTTNFCSTRMSCRIEPRHSLDDLSRLDNPFPRTQQVRILPVTPAGVPVSSKTK